MKRLPYILLLSVICVLVAISASHSQAPPAIVYVVIAIDTENTNVCWYTNEECQTDPNPLFDTDDYKYGDYETALIFSESYRDSRLDSYGHPFKMSWFVEMDKQYDVATYLDESPDFTDLTGTRAGYTAIMDTILRYWGSEISLYDDGIYWHHHVLAWTGSVWEDTSSVINGYTHHYDSINSMILDRAYFPTVYRSGWLWEDHNMNTFLNDWVPFDISTISGNWWPFHPNVANPFSSAPPNIERWMARSDWGIMTENIDDAFSHAQANGNALYSIFFHSRENMSWYIDLLQTSLEAVAADYPDVRFRYVNALDAFQSVLDFSDRTPPEISVTPLDAETYEITSDESLWQNTPYVTARYANAGAHYDEFVPVVLTGGNTWQAAIPAHAAAVPPLPTPPQYTPVTVTASGEHTASGGAAINAIDGDPNTMWDSAIDLPEGGHAGQVPAWIQLELPDIETVTSMHIHFYDDDGRYGSQYTYGVESSIDGINWTDLVSPGNTTCCVAAFGFNPPVDMRYFLVTVTDNSVNDWAHIKEIRLYGPTSPAPPETFYLQRVGAGASDLYGNPGVDVVDAVILPSELTEITVTPDPAAVVVAGGQVFSAAGIDQYGTPMAFSPEWTATGGTIDAVTGEYFAGLTPGVYEVTATDPATGVFGTASVQIYEPSELTEIAVTPDPAAVVVGDEESFTAAGIDQYGAPMAFSPVWTATGGTIDAVTGEYTAGLTPGVYEVTATDPATGVFGTATVQVIEAPELTEIAVTPDPSTVVVGGLQLFSAAGTDQYGAPMAFRPEWTAAGGTIDALTGEYTAGLTPGVYEVRATDPDTGLFGIAAVNVTNVINAFEVRVGSGSDDAEQVTDSGGTYLTSSDLDMTYEGVALTIGIRFNGIDIPQGASIINAYVQFRANSVAIEPTTLTIHGEDIDNAPTFTGTTWNISSRETTDASVTWEPGPWNTPGQAGPDQRTADLSPILEEILGRPGWTGGNSMAMIITGTGLRAATSYNGYPGGAPLLHVDYVAAPPEPSELTEITVTPDPAAVVVAGGQVFSAAGIDQYGTPMAFSPEWTATGGTIDEVTGEYFAGLTPGVYEVTVTDPATGVFGTASVQIYEPLELTQITVTPHPAAVVVGGGQVFSAAGIDQYGAPMAISPVWTATGGTIDAVTGEYTAGLTPGVYEVTATDPATGVFGTASVQIAEAPELAEIAVTPDPSTVVVGGVQVFSAAGTDQYGAPIPFRPEWTAAGGTIDALTGQYTAGFTPGIYEVRATDPDTGVFGVAAVNVTNVINAFEVRVGSGSDDAEQVTDSGGTYLTSSDLDMTYEGVALTIGIRFNGIHIPQGASIINAYVQFRANSVALEPTTLTIHGEDIDNAPTFTGTTWNISSRETTDASVTWEPGPWNTPGQAGPDQRTADLSTIIEEIIGRPGWADGNSMAMIITGTGLRAATSYNGYPGGAPLLHVDYVAAPPQSSELTEIAVTPDPAAVVVGGGQVFSAAGIDQYGAPMAFSPEWTATGGTIGAVTGEYTAGLTPGVYEVTATDPATGVFGTAGVQITEPLELTQITVTPDPATVIVGGGQVFSAAGIDQYGAPMAFSPVWTATGGIIDPVTGEYTAGLTPGVYEVTATDPATGVFGTAGVQIAEAPELTDIAVTPDPSTVVVGGVQLFSAAGTDQYGAPIPFRPEWTAAGGTIDALTGQYTAGFTPGVYEVRATDPDTGVFGVAAVNVTNVINAFEVRVGSGSDDAEQVTDSGGTYLTSSDLDMTYDGGVPLTIGIRFNGIDIPQGASIINAYVQFRANSLAVEPTTLTIHGEDIDNAPTFTGTTWNISSRKTTDASVTWEPGPWNTPGQAGPDQRTADLSTIIEDIIGRSGWTDGNSMAMIITGTGLRAATSYNGYPGGAPLLHVDYVAAP